jgi:hypothetical protein
MSATDIFMIWPENVAVSILTWLVFVITAMYIARHTAHQAIIALGRTIHHAMRLTARSFLKAEKRLNIRNREVLLAEGREAMEHMIEREFDRIDTTVNRELADYPSLQRGLSELVTKIDEDYKECSQVPPSIPAWEKAIDAVANIPSQRDPLIGNVLENIHQTMQTSYNQSLDEYRKSSQQHHKRLKHMLPFWRKIGSSLNKVDNNINSLITRSRAIDKHMEDYERIIKQEDQSMRMLSSSSITQFFIAAFVLLIAAGGAMINFNLIAHPMQEMVGGTSYVLGFKTSNIAAMVIILVEVAMGLFLMESLRITRLFPVIGAMNDKMRTRMIYVTFGILLILASVESGLAYMREVLAQDDAALRAALLTAQGTGADGAASSRWITTAAQMGMGFILPFALTFIAIPLESFIHSVRTVLGVIGVFMLRSFSFLARLTGNLSKQLCFMLTQIYDLIICAPLWAEHKIKRRRKNIHQQEELDTEPEALTDESKSSRSKKHTSERNSLDSSGSSSMMEVPL